MYDTESLTALRRRIDLVEMLQSHLELKRSGNVFRALCPFHDEKSPSFMVKSGDSHFHCFGCGAHGDGIDFLMRFLGLGFSQAVETLAEQHGIHLERRKDRGKEELGGSSKRRLKECLMSASRFYHFWLMASQEGQPARDYLDQRQIDSAFIERFQLGLAPQVPMVSRFLRDEGFSNKELQLVGLVTQSGREFFSRRILFPISDPLGAIVGFSGRKFEEDVFGGKYINSPDTPLFHKSHNLFGLSECRRRMAKERRAVIVEGQVDALRLIALGFDLACAPLGTAFAQSHALQLQKLGVKLVILAFDGDEAGQKAAVKAGHYCLQLALDVKIAKLPKGLDPDSLIQNEGLFPFEKLIEEALDFIDYLFEQAGDWSQLAPAAKQDFLHATVQEIYQWQHPILVHESLRRLAYLAKIPQSALLTPSLKKRRLEKSKGLDEQKVLSRARSLEPERAMESELIASLLQLIQTADKNSWLNRVQNALPPSALRLPAIKKCYQLILDSHKKEMGLSLSALMQRTADDEMICLLQEIGERKPTLERAAQQCKNSVLAILRRNWMMEREAIKREIQSGSLSDEAAMQKAAELAKLIQSIPSGIDLLSQDQ